MDGLLTGPETSTRGPVATYDISISTAVLWCGSHSHHYFHTTKIRHPVFPRPLIPLVEVLHSMRGNDWPEEIQIGASPTEI